MEYLAVKSQTKEGLLKYNSYHPLFGYVGLSHTYAGEFQYYLHLELIKENYLEEPFILAREGVTIGGNYLNVLQDKFFFIHDKKPFNKALAYRSSSEVQRDFFWDYKNEGWIKKENSSRKQRFYKNPIFVMAYQYKSSSTERKAIYIKQFFESLRGKNEEVSSQFSNL